MTIAKAVVTGTIYRAPEKRFTSNDVAIWAFVLDIGEKEETLLRVLSKRNALDGVVSNLSKGDRVLVEGRLQITNAKMEDGTERKIYEIDANTIESMGGSAPVKNTSNGEIVKFAQEEFSDELIGEDEIPF
jgi:single-strand DNA-binding protein